MNINQVIIGGNLVRDPVFKTLENNNCLAEFTVAVNRKFKVNGELREEVDFVPVIAWKNLAEIVRDRLKKGIAVIVLGRVRQDSWEKDGVKHSKTKIHAESVQFFRTSQDEKGGE